jgi:serine/threonine protein kinase
MKTEFNKPVGVGGQAHVYAVSHHYEESLTFCSLHSDPRVRESARSWPKCVIKKLRSDPTRNLNFQVSSALSEIKRLCQKSLQDHPNIVKLSGWGLCLDTLEGPPLTVPRLPFLILEKASYDLSVFLRSPEAHDLAYESLCQIALGIGRGLGAIHDANIAHGDLKPDNILVFDSRSERTQWVEANQRFIAKVCDFGSANEVTDVMNVKYYSGTPYWRPPEYYEPSPPASLQRCDIFTYGLVVWALFLRDPCSPILDIESKGASFLQETRGQQHYFDAASDSIQMRYNSNEDYASAS